VKRVIGIASSFIFGAIGGAFLPLIFFMSYSMPISSLPTWALVLSAAFSVAAAVWAAITYDQFYYGSSGSTDEEDRGSGDD
jgi:nitrate/nitrite transporter NarK